MIATMTPTVLQDHARKVADVLDHHFGFRAIVPIAEMALAARTPHRCDPERYDAFWAAVRAEGERHQEDWLEQMRHDADDARGDD